MGTNVPNIALLHCFRSPPLANSEFRDRRFPTEALAGQRNRRQEAEASCGCRRSGLRSRDAAHGEANNYRGETVTLLRCADYSTRPVASQPTHEARAAPAARSLSGSCTVPSLACAPVSQRPEPLPNPPAEPVPTEDVVQIHRAQRLVIGRGRAFAPRREASAVAAAAPGRGFRPFTLTPPMRDTPFLQNELTIYTKQT